MRKTIIITAAVATLAVQAGGRPIYGYRPNWTSADVRDTGAVALADINGDGWQHEPHEWKTGDGERHVFYLNHWPALTIESIRINGELVPRSDYCFDARAGWYSFKEAPEPGALVSVAYKWSNRLDLFAANAWKVAVDCRDAVYFNRDGTYPRLPDWLGVAYDSAMCCAAADFDADGDVDVAVAGEMFDGPAYVKVYENIGGTLEADPTWGFYDDNAAPISIAWGDVDNDGYLELAVADLWLDRFYVFKNAAGTLEGAPAWSADYIDGFSVAWGDFDADGDMDLAGGTYAFDYKEEGYTYLFRNNGGVLEKTHCWRNDPPRGRCQGLAWGDVNGDGWLDLVKGICGRGREHDPYADIYFSDRGVLPTTPGWESDDDAITHVSNLRDCDCDGRLDLIQAGARLRIHFQRGGGLEKLPSWKYTGGYNVWHRGFAVGDVDGDGFPDLAGAGGTATSSSEGSPNLLFLNKVNIGINVKSFAASACDRGVALRWEVEEAVAGFNLLREVNAANSVSEPAQINAELITGRSPYRYVDEAVEAGKTYRYWLEVVPLAGAAERHGPVTCTVGSKASFALAQNRPNPASSSTTVAFSVPVATEASLTIYDVAGRKVAAYTVQAKAGENEYELDLSALAPGVYTYRLEAGGEAASRKMVVIR